MSLARGCLNINTPFMVATSNAGIASLRRNLGQIQIIDVKSYLWYWGWAPRSVFPLGQKNLFSLFSCIVPPLEKYLQNSVTPLRGPVWVSKGEGFSPSGAKMYIQGVLLALYQRLKSAKKYYKQVSHPSLKTVLLCVFKCTWLYRSRDWHRVIKELWHVFCELSAR